MNKPEYIKIMSVLVESFPSKEMNLELIWTFVQDIPTDKFINSINRIITSKEDINSATNIIALIRKEALISDKKSAEMAWSEVLDKVRSVGYYGSPEFSSEEIKKSVECIGWKTICLSECIGVERAHFFRAYDGIVLRLEKNERTLPFEGSKSKDLIDFITKRLSVKRS